MTWPFYVCLSALKSSDLNMDDAVDLAQNHPLWRLMSTFGATHS